MSNDMDDDDYQPKWWNRIEPENKPDNPNSFMSKFSNVLGDSIDWIDDVIMSTLVFMLAFLEMMLTSSMNRTAELRSATCSDCDCDRK